MQQAQNILDYWFGELDPNTGMPKEDKYPLWFGKSEQTDQYLTENYQELLEQAKRGELDNWLTNKDSTMALIILLDQFSRNIYRDTPKMYQADEKAIQIAKNNLDANPPAIYRVFTYMPLMHSEELADQELCVQMFQKMLDEGHAVKSNLEYAIKHRDIVARFGRFPHRNQILNRESTSEEIEFLKQPGSSF